MTSPTQFETVPLSELKTRRLNLESDEHRPVVLVVDDEELIAETLVSILNSAGFAAMAAFNAESALDLASEIPPEVLITDIVMPGMDGIELAYELKRRVPDCKVLLFSGQVGAVEFRGRTDFPLLAKPVHPLQLLTEVSQLASTA